MTREQRIELCSAFTKRELAERYIDALDKVEFLRYALMEASADFEALANEKAELKAQIAELQNQDM